MTTVMTHSAGVHEMGPAVIAIGVFDGVHVGHQALVADTIALARQKDVASCVLTFDRDPDQIVTPDHAAPQLTSLEDKIALLSVVGPDAILIVPFDEWTASLTPDDFVFDVLLDASEPVACMVGYDFRFGTHASGDAETLRHLGAIHGFAVTTHPLIQHGGTPVTSTRIRELVSAGEVAEAAELLGRPHRLRGDVVRGQGVGRSLGAPTANLHVDARFALPASGVYAGWAATTAGRYPAAISVGVPPMFPDATCDLEVHLIGFDGELYGTELLVEFGSRLRDMQRFDSVDDLMKAIAEDIARAAELAAGG
ncbi:MAG: bifunctional riboflavin kinase/FAD synthetase [Actinobacteria bacterium]|nr:bifunctional riboflavin kinase/FAD synthetase [Actinomycetota bacterium]